jgi:O-antigen/teichoic acid export membrane protein
MRKFVRGTWMVGVNALVLMALFRLDAVLLAEMQGEQALGAYAAAYRLFETALFLTFAVSSAVFPLMSARANAADTVRRGVETGLATVAAVYLPFAVVCLVDAPGVLHFLFGAEYGQTSAGALRWLAFAPLAFAVAYLASAALTATNRAQGLLVGAVLALITNIGLNLFLIPRFAGTGAAFASTASYAVEAVVLLAVLARFSGRVELGRPLLESGLASAVLAVGLWVSPLHTALEVPLGGAVYAVMWWGLTRRFDPHHLQVLRDAVPGARR